MIFSENHKKDDIEIQNFKPHKNLPKLFIYKLSEYMLGGTVLEKGTVIDYTCVNYAYIGFEQPRLGNSIY